MRIIDPTFPTGGEPTPQFIDTSAFGVVPFRVVAPGETSHSALGDPSPMPSPGASRHPLPQAGEGKRNGSEGEELDALRVTLDAIEAETAWRGPPREQPLRERLAGASLVARLNAAIASLAALLAANPPPASKTIRLASLPTTVLLARGDLRPALDQADRALRWLEEQRRWAALTRRFAGDAGALGAPSPRPSPQRGEGVGAH